MRSVIIFAVTLCIVLSYLIIPFGYESKGTKYNIGIQRVTTKFSAGDGTSENPYQISNLTELQEMGDDNNLDKWFVLVNDIDANATKTWNSGEGFIPIGTYSNMGNPGPSFRGNLDGRNYTISKMYINRPSNDYVGLFGVIYQKSYVKNLYLKDIHISGYEDVGGLAGMNDGIIDNCIITGIVNGNNEIGGLVGNNGLGSISNISVDTNVSGDRIIGGFIGFNSGHGTIKDCQASGITIGKNSSVGGFAGQNYGQIFNCYSAGEVIGNSSVGGLIGNIQYRGSVLYCSATGNVTGKGNSIGGLVGYNVNGGSILNCSAYGNVCGSNNKVGGLIGENSGSVKNCLAKGEVLGENSTIGGLIGFDYGGYVVNCYANGNVYGKRDVGGLIGVEMCAPTGNWMSHCYATGNVSGESYLGGLIGSAYEAEISNCSATGNVNGKGEKIGGCLGNNDALVRDCYSTGNVKGKNYVGGFVGINNRYISNSYSTGNVSGDTNVGGFVGKNNGKMNNITAPDYNPNQGPSPMFVFSCIIGIIFLIVIICVCIFYVKRYRKANKKEDTSVIKKEKSNIDTRTKKKE